jgi:hypothetical protein
MRDAPVTEIDGTRGLRLLTLTARNPHDAALLGALTGPAPLANTPAVCNRDECLAQRMRAMQCVCRVRKSLLRRSR